jgi:hypothetical protein
MEIRRINSDYQFSIFNIFREILLILLQCFVCYYLVYFSRVFYYKLTKKIKYIFRIKFFSEIVFSIVTILYATFLIYIVHITSFKKLREYMFNIWKNLFSTDSNLRDLDSFVTFYCMDNFYNKKLENSKEKHSYQNEYEKLVFITKSAFESSITSLCRGFGFIDSQNIESFIFLGIFISQFVKNYEVLNNQIENNNPNTFFSNLYQILEEISLFCFKGLNIVMFIYFICVYIEIYMNYNKIFKLHYLQDTDKSIEAQSIKSKPDKYEKHLPPDNGEKQNLSWFDIFMEVMGVFFEILECFN